MEYESLFKAARQAGTLLAETETERLGRTLMHAAQLLRTHTPRLLEANARDLEAMAPDSPLRDRLRLTPERIAAIADDMEAVAHLPSPQGEELERRTRPNGMTIVKRRVPFGVVGMICEARPNVTADIFSLCIKTGNACVLKGGGDARHSNEAIAALLHEALRSEGIDEHAFTLLPSDHASVGALLNAVGYVDVVIPRGGAGLIRFVRENARVPVIETGAGIVHTYFDRDGDLAKGRAVVCNATATGSPTCRSFVPRWPPPASRSTPTPRLSRPSADTTPPTCWNTRPKSISARNSSTTNSPSGPSHRPKRPSRTSPATRRATAKPSSPRTNRPPRSSHAPWTPPASTSTSRRPSPTAASSASAPRWESRPRSSTPAVRWAFPN